jgi:putative ABC transport system permease protein
MKGYDLVELAGRNLRESVLRNSLTTVGIAVGVASLVAMLSLGIGLQQMATKRLGKSGLFDTVIVSSRRDITRFRRYADPNAPAPAESRSLDETARQQIAELPHVLEANPDIRFVTELRVDGKPYLGTVAGLPSSAKANEAFESVKGRFFSSDTAPEAILQKSFARELSGKEPKRADEEDDVAALATALVGKKLTLRYAERVVGQGVAYSVVSREQQLTIVGVIDLDPETMRGPTRARVFAPLKFAQGLHVIQTSDLRDPVGAASGEPTYMTLSVRVSDPKQVEAVQDAVRKMGFNTFSILDATRSLRRFFAVLDLFLGIFGSLALAVASIGIVNTLIMAILERRREIGIMKAIGASDADVKKLFLAEAGAMGVLGGVVGVTLGWVIGQVINLGTNVFLRRQELPPEQIWSVPWWLVAAAIAFAFVISLLSGWYPAARAARLDPVQTLRYE